MANDFAMPQSGPPSGQRIATIAIGAPQHPRPIGDRQFSARPRWRKFMQRGTPPPSVAFREWSISWRNRNWATAKRKSRPRFPSRSAPPALFFSKLAPYI